MKYSVEDNFPDDFAASAAKGAALAQQYQAQNLAADEKAAAALALSQEKARVVKQAVKSLSKIHGVKASFKTEDFNNFVRGDLVVKGSRYLVYLEAREPSNSIWVDVERNGSNGKPSIPSDALTDSGKTLTNTLQAIAMIAAYHYRDKETQIDNVIKEAIKNSQNPAAMPRTEKLRKNLKGAVTKAVDLSWKLSPF